MALTGKQQKFVVEYLRDFNATQAAIRAGYSETSAAESGCENLRNSNIKKAIDEELEYQGISIARAVGELAKIAYADMADYTTINEETGSIQVKGFNQMPLGASRAIKKVKEHQRITESKEGERIFVDTTTEIEHHNKLKAIELILQFKGAIGTKESKENSSEDPPGFNVSPDA